MTESVGLIVAIILQLMCFNRNMTKLDLRVVCSVVIGRVLLVLLMIISEVRPDVLTFIIGVMMRMQQNDVGWLQRPASATHRTYYSSTPAELDCSTSLQI